MQSSHEYFGIQNSPLGVGEPHPHGSVGVGGSPFPPRPVGSRFPPHRPVGVGGSRFPPPRPVGVGEPPPPPPRPIGVGGNPFPPRHHHRHPYRHYPYYWEQPRYYPSYYYSYYPYGMYTNYVNVPEERCFCKDEKVMGVFPNNIKCINDIGCGVCVPTDMCASNCDFNIYCSK